MIEVIPSVAILIIKNGKVLLVKHGKATRHYTGLYGLPSGRYNRGETAAQAAQRELEEETGLKSEKVDLLEFPNNNFQADIQFKDGIIRRCPWLVFLCKKFEGKLKSSEETAPEWVEIAELAEYQLLPNVKEAVLNGLKFINEQS